MTDNIYLLVVHECPLEDQRQNFAVNTQTEHHRIVELRAFGTRRSLTG